MLPIPIHKTLLRHFKMQLILKMLVTCRKNL